MGLHNVTPRLSAQNMRDAGLTNAKPGGKLLLRDAPARVSGCSTKPPDGRYVGLRQLGHPLPNAAREPVGCCLAPIVISARGAAFPGGVAHVVLGGAQEQVRRIHARGIVAAVADEHPGGDRPVSQLKGDAVGQGGPAPRDAEYAVAGTLSCRCPWPAPIWPRRTVDLRPEPHGRGNGRGWHTAIITDVQVNT